MFLDIVATDKASPQEWEDACAQLPGNNDANITQVLIRCQALLYPGTLKSPSKLWG